MEHPDSLTHLPLLFPCLRISTALHCTPLRCIDLTRRSQPAMNNAWTPSNVSHLYVACERKRCCRTRTEAIQHRPRPTDTKACHAAHWPPSRPLVALLISRLLGTALGSGRTGAELEAPIGDASKTE
ncbi:hypothetical protein BGZ61DRAFT_32225 [Ilyonectria robusta]|uniref:uncharacterized protein n=1 Tax=Ilyonectria robusta TaxID=1079257 RepID=UPI001E8D19E2|nr:uncharacterized protein BGZ61DRAFT_32225 [Ilyonectria robusta]KAH8694539.1 hypothetical protein BGZ61DRAFT_32225 [Ilyonectria robusta]